MPKKKKESSGEVEELEESPEPEPLSIEERFNKLIEVLERHGIRIPD